MTDIKMNLFDEVEYYFDQDLQIFFKGDDDADISFRAAQHILDATKVNNIIGHGPSLQPFEKKIGEFVYDADVQVLRNSITNQRSISWVRKNSEISKQWREDALN